MYKEREEFQPPPTEATLWRYMDFTKLISLLEKESLFFSKATFLNDPFEGSVPIPTATKRLPSLLQDGVPRNRAMELLEGMTEGRQSIRNIILLNCWHESDYESEAMWKLYGNDAGVAVKTTFERLSNSFLDERAIYIGRVRYIDYSTDYVSDRSIFLPYLHKRKSFQHEREVRAVLQVSSTRLSSPGNYVRINTANLIQEIVIYPYSPDWFRDLVESVVQRYELAVPVRRSEMDSLPNW